MRRPSLRAPDRDRSTRRSRPRRDRLRAPLAGVARRPGRRSAQLFARRASPARHRGAGTHNGLPLEASTHDRQHRAARPRWSNPTGAARAWVEARASKSGHGPASHSARPAPTGRCSGVRWAEPVGGPVAVHPCSRDAVCGQAARRHSRGQVKPQDYVARILRHHDSWYWFS
jgi:hypothetical protein